MSTNPFEDENKRVKPLISKSNDASSNTNPFEFDAGFQTVPKEETPILFGMDVDDELERSVHGHMPPPSIQDTTPATSKSTQQKTFGVKNAAMGWLGVKKKDGHVPLEDDDEEVTISPTRRKKNCHGMAL